MHLPMRPSPCLWKHVGKTVDVIQTQGESREERLVCHGPTGPLALSTLRAWLLHFPKTHGRIREQMPGGGGDADPAVRGPGSQDSPRAIGLRPLGATSTRLRPACGVGARCCERASFARWGKVRLCP